MQAAEYAAVGIEAAGWMFTTAAGEPVHPHTLSQILDRIVRRAAVPVIRLHDLRHTHGTILIADGVHSKVVSERLGHAWFAFTRRDLPAHAPRHGRRRRPRHRGTPEASGHRNPRAPPSRLNTWENPT
jgi:integrase